MTGCFFLGRMKALSYKERTRLLSHLCLFVSFIRDSIAYLSMPLNEIILSASRRADLKEADFIQKLKDMDIDRESFENVWSKVAEDLQLKPSEREELLTFCTGLGKTDRETQLSFCDITLRNLTRYKEEATKEGEKLSKMWMSLGAVGGAFAAIMLI